MKQILTDIHLFIRNLPSILLSVAILASIVAITIHENATRIRRILYGIRTMKTLSGNKDVDDDEDAELVFSPARHLTESLKRVSKRLRKKKIGMPKGFEWVTGEDYIIAEDEPYKWEGKPCFGRGATEYRSFVAERLEYYAILTQESNEREMPKYFYGLADRHQVVHYIKNSRHRSIGLVDPDEPTIPVKRNARKLITNIEAGEEPKKKRGRPPGSKNKKKES